ncbi:hypothetical protein KH5H1_27910 [Corallococcus caeni]|nr:hypothetical protein KH5H1_27910 [Corallococcus sp. KH5-1]
MLEHCGELITPFEHRVRRSLLIRYEERPLLEPPRVRQGYFLDDLEVNAALEGGMPAFLRGGRDRILREHADTVFIHRCERCRSILATPRARQCLWCGHDWH